MTIEENEVSADGKCGFVALIGAPNAGKSTLLNRLAGGKVSIVTHKAQTTRARVRAICVEGDAQMIFVDTPGIFAPRRLLDRAMVDAALQSAGDADIVVVVVDAGRGIDKEIDDILAAAEASGKRLILALNKIDAVERSTLLQLSQELNDRVAFASTYMISALNGDGVDDLRRDLAESLPSGPWLYPEDQMADLPMRMLAAEITREKVFLRLHDELPYESTVETEQWKSLRDGSIRIEQVVYVQRPGQRKIVLGEGGRAIKAIGKDAREELEEMLETRVHLFLFVKVRKNWSEDPERYRAMGLDMPKKK